MTMIYSSNYRSIIWISWTLNRIINFCNRQLWNILRIDRQTNWIERVLWKGKMWIGRHLKIVKYDIMCMPNYWTSCQVLRRIAYKQGMKLWGISSIVEPTIVETMIRKMGREICQLFPKIGESMKEILLMFDLNKEE